MSRLPSDIFSSIRERSWGPQAVRLRTVSPLADLSAEDAIELVREILEQIPSIVQEAIRTGPFVRREEVEEDLERALRDALGVSGAQPGGGLPLLLDDVRDLAAFKREMEAQEAIPEDEDET